MERKLDLLLGDDGQILQPGIHDGEVRRWSLETDVSLTVRGNEGDLTFRFRSALVWCAGDLHPCILSCMIAGPLVSCVAHLDDLTKRRFASSLSQMEPDRWGVLLYPCFGDWIIVHGAGKLEDAVTVSLNPPDAS